MTVWPSVRASLGSTARDSPCPPILLLCPADAVAPRFDLPASRRLYRPGLPTLTRVAPDDPLWAHEIKHDGYRFIGRRDPQGQEAPGSLKGSTFLFRDSSITLRDMIRDLAARDVRVHRILSNRSGGFADCVVRCPNLQKIV